MYNALLKRLKAIESHQKPTGQSFYSLCMKWHTSPKDRPQMAQEAEVNLEAACFIYETGLKYGADAGNSENPFSAWSTDEIRTALQLIGE